MKVKIRIKLVDNDGKTVFDEEYEYEYDLELLDRITLADLIEKYFV